MTHPLAAAGALAVGLLTALPAMAFDPAAMSPAERDAFGEEIRRYILENPRVIVEALEQIEAQEAEAQAGADRALVDRLSTAIYDDGFSWVGGNPDGDITLVEFLDYRCGFCRRAHPEVTELVESDGNIRLIVKEFPILGAESLLASQFAIAARRSIGPDAYKAVHDALITQRGEVTQASLTRIAADADLDAEVIFAEMESAADDIREELLANRALAEQLSIQGTPTFILAGEILRGYVPLDGMQAVVEDARADG